MVTCEPHEVIVMDSAVFGRMEQGRCISENDFIGCENDVLYLADRWCSGRNRCVMEAEMYIIELEAANVNCRSYLKMYTLVEYTCVKGMNIFVDTHIFTFTLMASNVKILEKMYKARSPEINVPK